MQIHVPANFSADDLAAFLRSRGAEGDGLTKEELVTATGRSEGWVSRQIRMLDRAGMLDVAWKQCKRVDGISCLKPAYSLKRVGRETQADSFGES